MDALGASRLRRPQSCVAIFFALAIQQVNGQWSAIQTYPVDWSVVPLSPPTTRNLTASCDCDLLNVGCSFGCCCDSKCPAAVKELFQSEGICLPSGTEQQTLKFCVPNGFMFKVNLPASNDFYVQPVEQADNAKFFSQLLCIVSDKNPNVGETYPDPPSGNSGDNAKLAQCPAAVSPPSKPDVYSFQSIVQAYAAGGATVKQPLTVPYPALSSQCNDQFAVGYLIPTPIGNRDYYSTCQRDLNALDLNTACNGSGLLTAQYYSKMRILTGRSSTSATDITEVAVEYLNPATGSLSKTANTTASYNVSTGLCSNVVRYLNMTLYYSSGYIDKVEVTMVLTDINLSSSPLLQGVRVSWIDSSQATNVQFVASGSPGYISGFPVLAGTKVTDSSGAVAIQRLVGGMPIPTPGSAGQCDATSFGAVKYGANFSSSCSFSLTGLQLRDFCTNNVNQPEKYLRLAMPTLLPSIENGSLYFGVWGDAEFNNTDDWIQVSVSGVPFNETEPIYSDDMACSGLVVGFDLQIVTGVAFSSNNLQQKVLYAKICFTTGVWEFPKQLPDTTANRFFLKFNVNFVRLPQQAVSVKKPTPPLVVPLPEDILYPFVVSDSAVGSCRVSIGLGVLAVTIVVLILQQVHEW